MTPHALLLLPLLALPAGPQAQGADPDGWVPYDWVEIQAGDEMITRSDVEAAARLAAERRRISLTKKAELDRLVAQTAQEMVLTALESQAAEDHEESPVDTTDRLDRFFADRRRDQGLVDYVEELQASGVSEQRYREQQTSNFYASKFRQQGLYGPRPTRDGAIRPGEQRELYRISGSYLAGEPSYRFQDMVVTADQVGGVEEARALAEELRQRLLDGEDFRTLHEEYGTTELDTHGVTRTFGDENPMPDPAIRRFALESEVGAVSPVYPVQDRRRASETVAFRVLVLYERTPAPPPPPFGEAETQERIRKEAGRNRDEIWLGVAREGLSESSFLWFNDHGAPPETVQGPVQDGGEAASAPAPATAPPR